MFNFKTSNLEKLMERKIGISINKDKKVEIDFKKDERTNIKIIMEFDFFSKLINNIPQIILFGKRKNSIALPDYVPIPRLDK